LQAQWRARADICLAFAEDPHTALLVLSTLAPHRWGFLEGNGNIFLSDHLHSRLPASPARALQLTHALDISTGAPAPSPALLPNTREVVQLSLLAAGVDYEDPLLLLCPQVDEERAWPMERWVALAAVLLADRPERVAVLGAPQVAWPDGVVKVMPVQDSLVLATLLARASLVIAPDAAALHLAGILGVPAVGLFGPTNPDEMTLPGSRSRALSSPEGLAALTSETVAAAIAEMLPISPHPAGNS
jgi:ADP-heptose:LPS heptosyltransferase